MSFPAHQLTPGDVLGLWANESAVNALRLLSTPGGTAGMGPDDLFDFVLLATGSRERAEAAAKERLAAQLRAGETPG